MHFEIDHVDDVESRYFWRAVADGGRILAWSENYPTKAACINALEELRRGAAVAAVVDRS